VSHERRVRRAAYVVIAGLGVQLGTSLLWTPLTFVLLATVGAPLVAIGIYLFLSTVWQILQDTKAL
jgi:hypothetical protein